MKARLLVSAALCAGLAAGLCACSKEAEAKTNAWSPHKVAGLLQSKHFKIDDVRRKGATYVVVADGPKGNKVRFVVDGRQGRILGMDVIKWAPGARRVKRSSHGTDFFDEFYEFGVTVPVAVYGTWTDYTVTQWSSSTEEYVELTTEETTETVTTEEVTYEESIQEVTEETAEEETVESSESSSSEESTSSGETVGEHSEAGDADEHDDADDSHDADGGAGNDDPH